MQHRHPIFYKIFFLFAKQPWTPKLRHSDIRKVQFNNIIIMIEILWLCYLHFYKVIIPFMHYCMFQVFKACVLNTVSKSQDYLTTWTSHVRCRLTYVFHTLHQGRSQEVSLGFAQKWDLFIMPPAGPWQALIGGEGCTRKLIWKQFVTVKRVESNWIFYFFSKYRVHVHSVHPTQPRPAPGLSWVRSDYDTAWSNYVDIDTCMWQLKCRKSDTVVSKKI